MATERWGSRLGLVLAMAGNAVGLGNFLRFPAQAAQNGGGAFLVPYLVALLVMGIPLIWVEWTMGRYGGQLGHHSTPGIFQSMGRHPMWKYLGVFGLWTNLIIAAYYLYIETWTMAFAGYSLVGGFSNPEMTGKKFHEMITGELPNQVFAVSRIGLVLFFACISINIYILSRGLAKGIEIVSKIGMPLLIGFGAVLAIRGLMISPETDPKAVANPLVGLNFVWEPKYDRLTEPSVWLAAAGQIFFTLSVGMGSAHCYASYLREQEDVTLTGATASWTNEFCEVILGGSILLPIAVAYQGLAAVQSQSGFALGFHVFPTLFQNWGWLAPFAGFMWFGLLFFAAITSSLAMGQPVLAFLQTDFGFTRRGAALVFGAMLLPLAAAVACFHQNVFFNEFDYWVGSFALVVMALIESILFAWVFGMDRGWAEMLKGAELQVPRVFYYILKYITPVFLLVILIGYIFQPKAGWDAYVHSATSGEPAPAWEWSGDGMIGKLLFVDVPIDPADPPEKQRFNEQVRFWRAIDRLILVGTFVGFSLLVAIAWRKRRQQGAH